MTALSPAVLVVDDEPYIVRSLSFVLERAGLLVYESRDGRTALEMIRRERPALVFLDIMMPAIDGYEVCRVVKSDQNLRNIYVIMLTAKGQEADRDLGFECGADEYVTKPFSPSQIVEKARSILARVIPPTGTDA